MSWSRRELLQLFAALSAGGSADVGHHSMALADGGHHSMVSPPMKTRPVPRTGEQLPVIGMGSYRTFDVSEAEEERKPLREVLRRLFDGGGRLIDSSPMYGRAEQVVGELLEPSQQPFLATKVWVSGREEGIAQMRRSMRRMFPRADRPFDLMQIHNLVDWRTHLATLRAWKEAGTIRYRGITHYTA